MKESRDIITGGADNYEENQGKYRQREFEEFSDNDSMDDEFAEENVKIGDADKSLQTSTMVREKRMSKWKNYNETFDNLTNCNKVMTKFPIVSCMITYDSSRTILVTKEDDTAYHIR